MKKVLALLLTAMLLVSLAACGEGEETTITGMVASVEGTVVSLVEMSGNRENMNFGEGQMPSMPEDFDGKMPNGEKFPQWGENGERPELPEGQTLPSMPEGVERPSFEGWDGQTPPTGEKGEGEKPSGEEDGKRPGMGNFMENMETTKIDIGDAHISVEDDGVKASGSLSDIKPGVFVTITKNGKGKVTNVLVTSMSGFGGGFRGGFGGSQSQQPA